MRGVFYFVFYPKPLEQNFLLLHSFFKEKIQITPNQKEFPQKFFGVNYPSFLRFLGTCKMALTCSRKKNPLGPYLSLSLPSLSPLVISLPLPLSLLLGRVLGGLAFIWAGGGGTLGAGGRATRGPRSGVVPPRDPLSRWPGPFRRGPGGTGGKGGSLHGGSCGPGGKRDSRGDPEIERGKRGGRHGVAGWRRGERSGSWTTEGRVEREGLLGGLPSGFLGVCASAASGAPPLFGGVLPPHGVKKNSGGALGAPKPFFRRLEKRRPETLPTPRFRFVAASTQKGFFSPASRPPRWGLQHVRGGGLGGTICAPRPSPF